MSSLVFWIVSRVREGFSLPNRATEYAARISAAMESRGVVDIVHPAGCECGECEAAW